jgi:hypothetical protein
MRRVVRGLAPAIVLSALAAVSCAGDDGDGGGTGAPTQPAQEVIECCMLRTLASRCSGGPQTEYLRQSVAQWSSVGNSRNNQACQALVNNEVLGCEGNGYRFDEADAIVSCS